MSIELLDVSVFDTDLHKPNKLSDNKTNVAMSIDAVEKVPTLVTHPPRGWLMQRIFTNMNWVKKNPVDNNKIEFFGLFEITVLILFSKCFINSPLFIFVRTMFHYIRK